MEMYSNDAAVRVYDYFSKNRLVILDNLVEMKFSRYETLVKQEEQDLCSCVLLVSIICRDNSTLSLRHFYSVSNLTGLDFSRSLMCRFACSLARWPAFACSSTRQVPKPLFNTVIYMMAFGPKGSWRRSLLSLTTVATPSRSSTPS